jgi:ABC-type nitrate/sulfonate/bicarbonate transport system permease component
VKATAGHLTPTPALPASTTRRPMRMHLSRRMTWGLRGTSLAITLALWEWYGRSTNPILFTYPTAIARAALDMLADGTLLSALGQSLSVLSTGVALGTLVGVGLGLLAGRSQVVVGLLDIPVTAL